MLERQLTVEEVADVTGDSPWTVRQLLRVGRMRGRKNGTGHKTNPWRVPESAVAEYMATNTNEKPIEAP